MATRPGREEASAANWERWGAASGLASLVTGGVGGALERGWPTGDDPQAVAAFVAQNRTTILAQSMAFLLSSAIFLWFLGSVRARLARAERGPGRLSAVAFGAGTVWVGLQMVAQAFQVGQAISPVGEPHTTLLWTMAAMFSIGNLPLAVMLTAVAIVSLRHHAFPRWSGSLAVLAATAQMVLFASTVVRSGPLAPNGWLTYTLYPMFAVWLVPTTITMMRRTAQPTENGPETDAAGHHADELRAAS